jgi:hypothetical protein
MRSPPSNVAMGPDDSDINCNAVGQFCNLDATWIDGVSWAHPNPQYFAGLQCTSFEQQILDGRRLQDLNSRQNEGK